MVYDAEDPKLVTLSEQEVSNILGFTMKALQKRRWLGQPPSYLKIGRLVRYRLSDIQDFLDSCRVSARENKV